MSAANSAALRTVKETTYGETPAGATWDFQRYTSSDLTQNSQTLQSAEINNDRKTRGIARSNVQAAGTTNHEFSFDTYDALLEGAVANDSGWNAGISQTGVQIDAATGPNAFTGVGLPVVAAGDWILVQGFDTPGNNGWAQVTGSPTTSNIPVTKTLVVEVGSGDESIKADRLDPGTDLVSYSLEEQHNDVTQFFLYDGMVISQFNFDAPLNGICTVGITWSGQERDRATSAAASAGTNAATTTNVVNTVDHFDVIYEAGAYSPNLCVQAFSLSIANNIDPAFCFGRLGPAENNLGAFQVSGSVTFLFDAISAPLIDKADDFLPSSLFAGFKNDAERKGMGFEVMNLNYGAPRTAKTGINTTVQAVFPFTVRVDSSNRDLQIWRGV